MKQLFALFLCITFAIQGQDFSKIKPIVNTYPRFSNVVHLAQKIEQDFSTQEKQAQAAFYWLANNIRYNLREFYNPKQRSYNFKYQSEHEKLQKLQAIKDKIVADAFRRKTGVCEEYAQSFKKICDLLAIEAAVITGNVRNSVKEIGKPTQKTNHAWNAVKINGTWQMLDATWAAGFEQNGSWKKEFDDYFYNMPNTTFFKTHFPEDTIWVLRFGRISLKEFYNQPIYGTYFLKSKLVLASPKTGFATVNTKRQVQLALKNLKPDALVFYTYKGQRYAEKPTILRKGKTSILTLTKVPKQSYLHIFIDRQLALQFKTR